MSEQFAVAFERLPLHQRKLISGAEHYGRSNVNSISGFLRGGDYFHALIRPVIPNVPKAERPILFWCHYGRCTDCAGDD